MKQVRESTAGRDTHGRDTAVRLCDELGESAALEWLRRHNALPSHAASACPLKVGTLRAHSAPIGQDGNRAGAMPRAVLPIHAS